MWWNLSALVVGTGLLIFALIPVPTLAVKYDIGHDHSGSSWRLRFILP
jgi:hypothetical protein